MTFEILQMINPTSALATIVTASAQGRSDIHDNANNDLGVNRWRIQKLARSLSNDTVGKNQFELVWRPPLGFFELPHAIPPGGQWMIEFNPANPNDCRENVVESLLHDLQSVTNPPIAGQFDFQVDEFQFYVYLLEAE